jgi:hypothetical protein
MTQVLWPLWHGRPSVRIVLTLGVGGKAITRIMLADSGAGSLVSGFELILEEDHCLLCDGFARAPVNLAGAYRGSFPRYDLTVQVPELGFTKSLRVVGVPSVPSGFDGIACFRFLNRFHYGTFGDAAQFGLES